MATTAVALRPTRFVALLTIAYALIGFGVALLEQGLPAPRPLPEAVRALGLAALVWSALTLGILALVRHAEDAAWSPARRVVAYGLVALGATWVVNGVFVGIGWMAGGLAVSQVPGELYARAIHHLPANAAWAIALSALLHLIFTRRSARTEAVRRDPPPSFTVCLGRRRRVVPVHEVRWIEGDGDYVRLHTSSGSHVYGGRLYGLERALADHGFIRVHRSALVNAEAVTGSARSRQGLELLLTDGRRIPVSRRRRAAVRRALAPSLEAGRSAGPESGA